MLSAAALEAILKPIIADSLQQFPFIMQGYIGTNMDYQAKADRIAPSKSDKIATYTGTLFRSFTKGQPGNIYKVTEQNGKFDLEYGSSIKYAKVHEFGMFIKATPVTVLKSKSGRKLNKSTYVMAQFFWAKYAETKQPYFRNIALSVEKNGGINIPARPYFNPAVQKFSQDTKFANNIKQQVKLGIQKWQENQRRSNQ